MWWLLRLFKRKIKPKSDPIIIVTKDSSH
jgi:hypothetical protein